MDGPSEASSVTVPYVENQVPSPGPPMTLQYGTSIARLMPDRYSKTTRRIKVLFAIYLAIWAFWWVYFVYHLPREWSREYELHPKHKPSWKDKERQRSYWLRIALAFSYCLLQLLGYSSTPLAIKMIHRKERRTFVGLACASLLIIVVLVGFDLFLLIMGVIHPIFGIIPNENYLRLHTVNLFFESFFLASHTLLVGTCVILLRNLRQVQNLRPVQHEDSYVSMTQQERVMRFRNSDTATSIKYLFGIAFSVWVGVWSIVALFFVIGLIAPGSNPNESEKRQIEWLTSSERLWILFYCLLQFLAYGSTPYAILKIQLMEPRTIVVLACASLTILLALGGWDLSLIIMQIIHPEDLVIAQAISLGFHFVCLAAHTILIAASLVFLRNLRNLFKDNELQVAPEEQESVNFINPSEIVDESN